MHVNKIVIEEASVAMIMMDGYHRDPRGRGKGR
jgi:hypothetical protein